MEHMFISILHPQLLFDSKLYYKLWFYLRWKMYLHGARDMNEAMTSIDPNASCDFFTNVLGLLLFL